MFSFNFKWKNIAYYEHIFFFIKCWKIMWYVCFIFTRYKHFFDGNIVPIVVLYYYCLLLSMAYGRIQILWVLKLFEYSETFILYAWRFVENH